MQWSASEVAQLARQAGVPSDQVPTAVAIATAESGLRDDATGRNSDGSRDRGLWQINSRAHPEVSDACAYDARCNAQAMARISKGGRDWHDWTTYTSGAYRQFLSDVSSGAGSLFGQGVIGETITTPWLPGSWEVTQGWGSTPYTSEPEGHGAPHWHAGVDIGCPTNTPVYLPNGLSGTVRWLDNPDGYGTALIVTLDSGVDIYLGHLMSRIIPDGSPLRGGEHMAQTDSTGNSTGPHLHFEVRPKGGRYGTDIDPSPWILDPGGAGGSATDTQFTGLELPWDAVGRSITDAEKQAEKAVVGTAQTALGIVLALAAGGLLIYGLRGKDLGHVQRAAIGAHRSFRRRAPGAQDLLRKRIQERPGQIAPGTAAASRVRRSLQRAVPQSLPAGQYEYRLSRLRESTRTGQPIRRAVAARTEAAPRIKGDRFLRLQTARLRATGT